MSDRSSNVARMDEGENAARISGLCAMLALPMLECGDGLCRKRIVEIEYQRDRWETIDGVEVTAMTLLFWRGRNGSTIRFSVPATRCPAWRIERQEQRAIIERGDPRKEWLER